MRHATNAPMDKATLRRLWTSLPSNQVDRSFWAALETFCEPFLNSSSPFYSQTFFSMPHTGRILQEELVFVDEGVVKACNDVRPLYDTFTLWNPLALGVLLKTPIEVVTAQLLLAVQHSWVSLYFVINCRSCGVDIAHFRSVNDISFVGTFHSTNAFRCPMCTDRTEVNELNNVAVYFHLERLPTTFKRRHHRLYYTEEADRRRLESFFCPAQAKFAFTAYLPQGRYLLSAPFCGSMVEYAVGLSAEVMTKKDPFLPCIVDLKDYIRSQNSSADSFGKPIKRRSTTAALLPRRGGTRLSISAGDASLSGDGAPSQFIACIPRLSQNENLLPQSVEAGGGFGAEDVEEMPPIQVINLKHGKVQFRIYNDTPHSGFLDLSVAFDTRTEFCASPYPQLFRVPHFMHCLPRGMRSPFLTTCIPRPPSTTPTTGAYVRHQFALTRQQADDPNVISVLREVHCYSLEDHHGLLIGVSDGGISFESTFLSTTAALASSICFFQRVLTRLGEPVALAMRCSVTEGPLKIAAYQGQYNDADNSRSSYPDAQFVGSVVYASNHPPITGHYFYCTELERPRTGSGTGKEMAGVRSGLLGKYRSPAWLNEDDGSFDESTGQGGSYSADKSQASGAKQGTQRCLVRFEVRCVSSEEESDTELPSRRSSTCPRLGMKKDGSHSTDVVFPHFLEFLREHFEGASIKEEAHALIVQLPLPIIYATLQMSTTLHKSAYSERLSGPF